jgi:hypothetical protein
MREALPIHLLYVFIWYLTGENKESHEQLKAEEVSGRISRIRRYSESTVVHVLN